MRNPTMTSSLYEKEFIDLTFKDQSEPVFDHSERLMLVEAHEMASFAYDMVNLIFEFNKPSKPKSCDIL